MSCVCDGRRRRRHAHPAKAQWYASWRSFRFARRFSARREGRFDKNAIFAYMASFPTPIGRT